MKILSKRARAPQEEATITNPGGPHYGYTAEQVVELQRCAKSPLYFIQNYCTVDNPLLGKITMQEQLAQSQVVFDLEEHRKIIVKAPRQAGMTTIGLAYALWKACFRPHQTILHASVNHMSAVDARAKFLAMYDALPSWLSPSIKFYNRRTTEFDNGSVMHFSAVTEHLGSGLHLSLCILDAFAYNREELQAAAWYSIYPAVLTGQVMIVSSPNVKDDKFYKLWMAAEAGSGIHPVSIEYWMMPCASAEHRERMTSMVGEMAFRRDYLAEFV